MTELELAATLYNRYVRFDYNGTAQSVFIMQGSGKIADGLETGWACWSKNHGSRFNLSDIKNIELMTESEIIEFKLRQS